MVSGLDQDSEYVIIAGKLTNRSFPIIRMNRDIFEKLFLGNAVIFDTIKLVKVILQTQLVKTAGIL